MKAALIGCGRIGFLLENDRLRKKPCTHFGGAMAAGIKINYACDINRERLEKFAEVASIPDENLFNESTALLGAVRPDLVIIATWTESHASICMDAAENGAGVIVLEKPISPSLTSASAILRTCGDRGSRLIVNHERRFDARYRKLRDFIDSGGIGEIKSARASILTSGFHGESRPEAGGGPLLHDGTHLVDMVRFLFGDIEKVRGEFWRQGRRSGYEDGALAWMKTSKGVDVFLEAGGRRDYFSFELDVSGTSGRIMIGNGYERLYLKGRSRLYTGFNDLIEKPFPAYDRKKNCFRELYVEAAGALSGKTDVQASSGIDGYRALEAIHAVYLSAYKKKEIILPMGKYDADLKKIFGMR